MAHEAVTSLEVTFVSSHARSGGSERYLATLLDELGSAWIHQVVCLADGPLVAELEAAGGKPLVIPTGAGPPSIALSAVRLRKTLKKSLPAVVHANGVKAATVCVLATLGLPVPVVWAKHDFSWDGPLARTVARRSAIVVGISRAVLDTFAGMQIHTRVVHNGLIPFDGDRELGRRMLIDAAGPGNSYVGIVGRLHPVKGHAELIASAPDILRVNPGTKFVFVGGPDPSTPEHEAMLRSQVSELGLNDNITFVGERSDVLELMSGLDVGVVPSVTLRRGGKEGFPTVGLELMAAGVPVVAYDHGGVAELLADCGRLVPPGDRAVLATAISALLADERMREALAACGRERVKRVFTLDRTIAAMKTVYRDAGEQS